MYKKRSLIPGVKFKLGQARKDATAMTGTKFSSLSSLVLVDTLAALPMEHVVRLACLGPERLRQTCSFKWVKDRMTDVSFQEILKAYQLRGHIGGTFCGDSVIKRLNGEVKIPCLVYESTGRIDDYVELAKKITGVLHISFECSVLFDHKKRIEIAAALSTLPGFIYASQTLKRLCCKFFLIDRCPEMVFDYRYCPDKALHNVYYRPALLNGGHVVDVLRAVCGSADVSEAELDRVKRAATEKAGGISCEGVWYTFWHGAAITAKV